MRHRSVLRHTHLSSPNADLVIPCVLGSLSELYQGLWLPPSPGRDPCSINLSSLSLYSLPLSYLLSQTPSCIPEASGLQTEPVLVSMGENLLQVQNLGVSHGLLQGSWSSLASTVAQIGSLKPRVLWPFAEVVLLPAEAIPWDILTHLTVEGQLGPHPQFRYSAFT